MILVIPRAACLLSLFHHANAQDFPHNDCFNVYGEDTGVTISQGRKAAFSEGFQLPDGSRLTLSSGALTPVTQAMRSSDDAYPIPDECFAGADELGRHGAHYDLIPCSAGRQPEDMARICMTVCSKVPGCIGIEYDEFHAGQHHCHLHGEVGDSRLSNSALGVPWPKCAHAPTRFLCSDRKLDEWLGMWCPPDPLPAMKYQIRDKGVAPNSLAPPTWIIGGDVLFGDSGGAVACNCDEDLREERNLAGNSEYCATEGVSAASQAALGDTLEEIYGVQKARIECSTVQPDAPRSRFVYWLEIEPGLDPAHIHAQIDTANCENDANDPCVNAVTNDISVRMQDKMSLASLPAVEGFGLSSWTKEGYRTSNFQDMPDCVTNGQLSGFGISPNHHATVINNINFLPEEHGETRVFLKSMSDPNDWFPIPDGCFFDTEVDGSPSNPALMRFGRHFELLGPTCLGNRTEQEMLNICLTICSHLNYGESAFLDGEVDKGIDMGCVGVNYDEHGDKGHCHPYTQFDFRVSGFQSSTCSAVRGVNHNDICTQNDIFTSRSFCTTVGLSGLGSPSCGHNNTLGIFCHFNTLTCTTNGYHAMGVDLLTDDLTDIIPRTVAEVDEETLSPLFGAPGGAGRAGACKQCAATTFSSRVMKNYEHRDVIPQPLDYPDTVNVCKPCPEGRYCQRGVGCSWGGDEYSCPPRCLPGSYCPAEVDAGIPCRVNHYQPEDGQASCNLCPTGFTFGLGSDNLGFCLCPNGMRRKDVSSTDDTTDVEPCTACLEGMICEWDGSTYIEESVKGQFSDYPDLVNAATNFQTVPHLLAGYWADTAAPLIIYKCDATLENEDCLGGPLILPATRRMTNGTASALTQCRGLTERELCNMCPDGYMKDVNAGGCAECGPAYWIPAFLVLLAGVIGFVIFYTVSAKMISVQAKRLRTGPKGLDMGTAMVLLGRVVQTIQLLSICSALSIPWPKSLSSALASTNFIKFDLNGLQIGCMVGQSALLDYFVKSVFIVLIVLFLPICCGISRVFPETYKMSGAVTLHVCGTLLTVLFLSFTTVGFSPFVCLQHPATEAGTTMAMYPHVDCWQGEHIGMVLIGLVVLLSQIASLCFIAYACFMLPKYSVDAKHRDDAMVSVKFVYGNYRADVWFYSFLMLLRNLVTAFVPALAPNSPGVQLAIMTQSLIFSFCLHCYLWPWHMPLCNAMDFVSLSCVLSLSVLAAAWLPRATDEDFFVTVTEVVMFVAIIGGFLVASFSFLLMTPFSKKNNSLQNLGVQMHLLGHPPAIDETSDMLNDTCSRMANKTKEQLTATIKDLDAYDKRKLMFFSKFIDSEFHVASKSDADAPQPMKRIKSTASLEGGEEEKTPKPVITV